MSGQLNEIQSLFEETKRGMEVVRGEHDEGRQYVCSAELYGVVDCSFYSSFPFIYYPSFAVSRASRSVEARLIQVESELIRAARAKKDAVEERDFLKTRAEKLQDKVAELQDKVDDSHDEIRMLKKDLVEVREIEKVRSNRAERLESEFQEARSGLLEATCAAAEAESTVTSLRSVIEELRRENESLHDKIASNRDNLLRERSKQHDALAIAEKDAQKWKMKVC